MIAEKIRKMLEIRGMSQLDLVRITGLSKSTVNGLTTGYVKNTSIDTIKMIAKALHVNPAYFIDEDLATPFDVLAEIPEEVRNFMLELDNMPYMKLSRTAKEKGITPEMLEGLIDTLTQCMNRQTSTNKQ